jgi:dTDP-4-dehydrorhamnose reductase
MSVVIFGAQGQVGRALKAQLPHAIVLCRNDYNVASATADSLAALLAQFAPHTIYNAAAYTQVDEAEKNRDAVFMANAEFPALLASWCAQHGARLVHYSTDYVFDGQKETPYSIADIPRPLNLYGQSKLAGEQAILASGSLHVIIRTSWVFDGQGKNFFTTMKRLMQVQPTLQVVADQIGAPTFAGHLAQASMALAMHPEALGMFHLSAQGCTSWHGFACAIHSAMASPVTQTIIPILASEYPLPAKRPANSILDNSRANALGITLPHWTAGLKAAMADG